MKKLRWKKDPKVTGLAAVGSGPRGSYLHDGEQQYASVGPLGGGWRPMRGWYWVAGWESCVPYFNSCNNLVPTEEEAKLQASNYVNQHLK
jgi:hypothetical protein